MQIIKKWMIEEPKDITEEKKLVNELKKKKSKSWKVENF